MAKSLRFLFQTYAHPSLSSRLAVLEVLESFGCPPPYTQEGGRPPFDAPEGQKLSRVFVVDLPKSLEEAQEGELELRLRETGAVQYVLAL